MLNSSLQDLTFLRSESRAVNAEEELVIQKWWDHRFLSGDYKISSCHSCQHIPVSHMLHLKAKSSASDEASAGWWCACCSVRHSLLLMSDRQGGLRTHGACLTALL